MKGNQVGLSILMSLLLAVVVAMAGVPAPLSMADDDARTPPVAGTADGSMQAAPQGPPSSAPPSAEVPASPAKQNTAEEPRAFIAYYFHRTMRCPSCLAIEEHSRQAIEAAFAAPMALGLLEWRAVNLDDPGQGHFEQDFQLQSSSLVLVESAAGKVQRWETLAQVWELVEDPPALRDYVVTEIGQFAGW